jgi:hypothetical protein
MFKKKKVGFTNKLNLNPIPTEKRKKERDTGF